MSLLLYPKARVFVSGGDNKTQKTRQHNGQDVAGGAQHGQPDTLVAAPRRELSDATLLRRARSPAPACVGW